MPALSTTKYERFCVARVQGMSQTRAAIAAGYSVKRASSTGCMLARKPEIVNRISELSVVVAQRSAQRSTDLAVIDKEMVLQGIAETIELARAANKFSDMLKGYELLGKHLKLFDRAGEEIPWDGDLSKLTDEQLEYAQQYWRKLADPAVVARVERQLALESGEIIDVEPIPEPPADSAAPGEDAW